MVIKFKLTGSKSAIKKFKKVPNAMLDEVKETMKDIFFNFIQPDSVTIAGEKLSRNSRGGLRRNIKVSVKIIGKTVVVGRLGVNLDRIPYARLHELGGTIFQTITAKQRKFFWAKHIETGDSMWKGMALTKKKLIIKIPKRSYLRPAIERNIPLLKKQLIKNLNALEKQIK